MSVQFSGAVGRCSLSLLQAQSQSADAVCICNLPATFCRCVQSLAAVSLGVQFVFAMRRCSLREQFVVAFLRCDLHSTAAVCILEMHPANAVGIRSLPTQRSLQVQSGAEARRRDLQMQFAGVAVCRSSCSLQLQFPARGCTCSFRNAAAVYTCRLQAQFAGGNANAICRRSSRSQVQLRPVFCRRSSSCIYSMQIHRGPSPRFLIFF